MPLPPLVGHDHLRAQLDEQVRRGTLASSLLLTGPAGVGKQRVALWLAQRLLCAEANAPCGACQACRYAEGMVHPDLTWIFPRPRLKDATDVALEDVAQDFAEAAAARCEAGLYARPDGSEGIYVYATRLLVQRASRTPALARRKVFVVGEADRMVPQASSQEAANAFLKLLEEPPADTTLILTSSEPGALLPTIRSRTIEVRVRPVSDDAVRAFLATPAAAPLAKAGKPDALVALARGSIGSLLAAADRAKARDRAAAFLAVAEGDANRRYRVAYAQGSTKARGAFSDALDALTELLHERARDAATVGNLRGAAAFARAVPIVETAKRDAERNAVPQLIAFDLMTRLAEVLQ